MRGRRKLNILEKKKLSARHRPSLLRWLRAFSQMEESHFVEWSSAWPSCVIFVISVCSSCSLQRDSPPPYSRNYSGLYLVWVVTRSSKSATAAKACVQKIKNPSGCRPSSPTIKGNRYCYFLWVNFPNHSTQSKQVERMFARDDERQQQSSSAQLKDEVVILSSS